MRILAVILTIMTTTALAQLGSYQSLALPFGARNVALGGKVVSLADGDVMQAFSNPATIGYVDQTSVGLNYMPFFVDIHAFNGAYCSPFPFTGKAVIGLSYLDFGDFQGRQSNGDVDEDYTVNDLVFSVGTSHSISSFSLGINLKYASNTIAGYGSSLILGDLGGVYKSPTSDFTIGMVLQNFGFVVADYTSFSDEKVPFDVLISTSVKPEHMPFRFSLSAYNLAKSDLYFLPDGVISRSKNVEIADKIFRKINVATELIISDGLQFLLGYSHLRKQELQVNETGYGAGFSFGLKLNIKNIQIRYSHATYHAAGGIDSFNIQTRLNSFKKSL